MYENPESYLEDQERHEEKKRRWCLERALELAEKKSPKDGKTEYSHEDVVEAADNFREFVTPEPGS